MSFINYKEVSSFDFRGLEIREITPKNLHSASVAEIKIRPSIKHETARSTKSDKLYICTEGEVLFQVENENFLLKTNDVLLIPKGRWFNYHNQSPEISTVILVHIPPFDIETEEFKNTEKPPNNTI